MQSLSELLSQRLVRILGDRDRADIQADLGKSIDQAEHFLVVCDAEVTSSFILLDRIRIDRDNDLDFILQLHEHLDFAVRLKARKNTGGVVIVEEFSAEFQIQLTAEFSDTVTDLLRLHLHVLFIAKAYFKHTFSRPFCRKICLPPLFFYK